MTFEVTWWVHMALDPDSIVQQGIGLSLLTLKSFTPVIIFSDSDFKSSHNKNDYTCVMNSTLTITRPRSRITSHFVIQFWKVFNVHACQWHLYVFKTCLVIKNTLAYLIYLTCRRFLFDFKWKYIRKLYFVFAIIIYYCMVMMISIQFQF